MFHSKAVGLMVNIIVTNKKRLLKELQNAKSPYTKPPQWYRQKVLPIISDVRFPTQLFPYRCSSKDKVYRNYKFLCRFCFYSAHILFVLARQQVLPERSFHHPSELLFRKNSKIQPNTIRQKHTQNNSDKVTQLI